MSYGLAAGVNITYGSPGFPSWVYELGSKFGLQASTYPGHQESERAEAGFAPNPQHLNRGIDWTGAVSDMQRFAEYLLSVRGSLEQVIWENPHTGQRVGVAGGDDVTTTRYYADYYSGHRDHVHSRQSAPIPIPGGQPPSTRPPFTEIEVWSDNVSVRGGTKVDLFILHTQEGGNGDAQALAQWMNGNGVSYHYTVSTGRPSVTVCDVVDTDLASWSVLSANNRSINLCFAGSKASWSRQQWLDNTAAIDAAAFLAVQDCRKYGIPITVIAPPYASGRAGITDHNYVTQVLKDGSHTDVGANFPWDVFAAAVAKYSGATPKPTPTPTPVPDTGGFMSALTAAEQRELYNEIMARRNSRSPLRHVGEGAAGDLGDMVYATDGSVHVLLVQALARLGDPDSLRLLNEVASLDSSRFPDRIHDRQLAQAILNDIANTTTVESAPPTGATPGIVFAPAPVAPAVVPAAVVRVAPAAVNVLPGGLFAEIQSLTNKLQDMSAQVTQQLEGTS